MQLLVAVVTVIDVASFAADVVSAVVTLPSL